MPIKRIQTTVYFVRDWDASISFYRDVLGLKPLGIVPRVWAQFEAPGGGRIALQAQSQEGNDTVRVSIDVSEIRGFVADLEAKGVTIIEQVRKQDYGDSALIADPSGNVIGLIDLSTSKMPHD
jgi:predicted enzyme related to lactoylglutathione lyase